MPAFWSYVTNGKYSVGCTGQTVFVYSAGGEEFARFRDLKYAYTAAISPKGDIFAVKTTEGRLGIYSLESMSLIKKFRFSKVDGSQDDGFCFSPDGELFYNVERHRESFNSAISVYRTEDFSLESRSFEDDGVTETDCIEFGRETGDVFVLGFFRGDDRVANRYYVAKLKDTGLADVMCITENEHEFYRDYNHMKLMGFTKRSKEWSALNLRGYDLETIDKKDFSLEKLWLYYSERK